MSKKKNIAEVADIIYNEYVAGMDLSSSADLMKCINVLLDNGKAVKISGTDDVYYKRLSRYKIASKFMIDHDKKLRKDIKSLLPAEESNCINKAGDNSNKRIVELVKSGLDYGTYTVTLESSNKTEDYAILEVERGSDYDDYKISYNLYFVGNKCEKYKNKFFKMVDKYKKLYEDIDKNLTYIHYSESDETKEVTFKGFDQMVFSQKEKIISYVDNWVENIPKYYKYGMNPKLSILLYGVPGTGKSTFYKALAKHLGINTVETIEPEYFTYSTNDDGNSRSRRKNNNNTIESKLFAIDEIDCICKTRTEKSDNANNDKILSKLLSFLDNPPTFYFKANDGMYYPISIVVATTNYIDKIDPAVKRFGRFDLQIEMKDFTLDEAKDFCALYDLTIHDVVNKVEKDFTISPAKLQALCMENIDKSLKDNKRRN